MKSYTFTFPSVACVHFFLSIISNGNHTRQLRVWFLEENSFVVSGALTFWFSLISRGEGYFGNMDAITVSVFFVFRYCYPVKNNHRVLAFISNTCFVALCWNDQIFEISFCRLLCHYSLFEIVENFYFLRAETNVVIHFYRSLSSNLC